MARFAVGNLLNMDLLLQDLTSSSHSSLSQAQASSSVA